MNDSKILNGSGTTSLTVAWKNTSTFKKEAMQLYFYNTQQARHRETLTKQVVLVQTQQHHSAGALLTIKGYT